MRDEVQVLQTLGAKFMIEGQQNKWRGMQRMLEMMEEKENDIYYAHHYWYVIAGKSS
jgi:splicing suppressor protein 51